MLRSVPNPRGNSAVGKSIPNISVNKAVGNQRPNHSVNSGVQNGVSSEQDQKVQNKAQVQKVWNNTVNTNQEQKGSEIPKSNSIPIVNSVPSSEKLSEPNNTTGNGDTNKTIPKVSAPKSPCPKPSVQENTTCREIK